MHVLTSSAACVRARAQAALWPQMEWNVRRVLGNDVSAISTLRCLKLFLERLGANHLDAHTSHALAGAYLPLVPASLHSPCLSVAAGLAVLN